MGDAVQTGRFEQAFVRRGRLCSLPSLQQNFLPGIVARGRSVGGGLNASELGASGRCVGGSCSVGRRRLTLPVVLLLEELLICVGRTGSVDAKVSAVNCDAQKKNSLYH